MISGIRVDDKQKRGRQNAQRHGGKTKRKKRRCDEGRSEKKRTGPPHRRTCTGEVKGGRGGKQKRAEENVQAITKRNENRQSERDGKKKLNFKKHRRRGDV